MEFSQALLYSLTTGVVSTLLALGFCLWLLSRLYGSPAWMFVVRALPAMLALPHAAFAVGAALWIAPTGWTARLLALWAGWSEPPAWATVQDPLGLGLILVLTLKEAPFLLWMCASQLQRDDVGPVLLRQLQVAHSLGHSRASAWWRVAVPSLLPRLRWPLLAVLAYGLTVVDVAQIIGPGSPPTLAVLAWQGLQSPSAEDMAQGTTAAWMLTLCLLGLGSLVWWPPRGAWPQALRHWWVNGAPPIGPRGNRVPGRSAVWGLAALLVFPYLAVVLALGLASVSGVWRFPALWPQSLDLNAWASVQASPEVLRDTVSLALASSSLSLAMAVAWLEWMPAHWDARLRPLVYVPLVLPALLWVVGLHHLALRVGLTHPWWAVLLAHCVAVWPYALIALSPAYQGFDQRLWHTASSLGHGRWRFLLRIKWPLLRAALWSALAVGFAVSVAQYVPTLYLGGGRISTVTTEAVTLASGGQRSLGAAFAWLQWTLPALGFGLAAWAGRPRWSAA